MSKEKEMKYGVAEFAKAAGVEPATARVLLRNGGIKKSGRSYGWESQGAMKAALEKCRKASPARDDKPAKKASRGKPAKKRAKATVRKRADKQEGDNASA